MRARDFRSYRFSLRHARGLVCGTRSCPSLLSATACISLRVHAAGNSLVLMCFFHFFFLSCCRRIVSRDTCSLPGARGTVVAFLSSRTEHRGLANRSEKPRVLMYIAFESDEGQDPATFKRQTRCQ